MPSSHIWSAVTFGNGIFVAVASDAAVAATSLDGRNWTQRTMPVAAEWTSVTYGNGLFVAVGGGSGGPTDEVARSVDGINWVSSAV